MVVLECLSSVEILIRNPPGVKEKVFHTELEPRARPTPTTHSLNSRSCESVSFHV